MSSKYLEYVPIMIKNLKKKRTQSYCKASECVEYLENEKPSLLGKISIFGTLAFSKNIHPTLVTSVPSFTIDLSNNIQKDFPWGRKNGKIKHTALCCCQLSVCNAPG